MAPVYRAMLVTDDEAFRCVNVVPKLSSMRVGRLLSTMSLTVSLAVAAACVDFDGLSAGTTASGGPGIAVGDVVLRGVAQVGPVAAHIVHELPVPPETREGDLMILAAFNDRKDPESVFEDLDASLGAALGWRQILRLSPASCGTGRTPAGLIVYVKIAGPAERNTYVRYNETADPLDMSSSLLSVWGGVDPQAPIDATMFVAPGNALEAPSVTTTGPRRVLLALFSNSAASGASTTPPPGMTQRASTGHLALFSELLPNAGDTGPRVAQTAREICGAAALSLALRPAPR